LHAKLSDCYKKGVSPNLDPEITLLNDAPLNTMLSSQALGDNQEESKGAPPVFMKAVNDEMAKGGSIEKAHDCDDEHLDLY
jgi:hypothetical protein